MEAEVISHQAAMEEATAVDKAMTVATVEGTVAREAMEAAGDTEITPVGVAALAQAMAAAMEVGP